MHLVQVSIVQEFVEILCKVTDTNLCMSTFTTLKYTYLNNSPNVARLSRGLCDKVGPESHIMKAPPQFYRHSVTGTVAKSR